MYDLQCCQSYKDSRNRMEKLFGFYLLKIFFLGIDNNKSHSETKFIYYSFYSDKNYVK